MRSEKGRPALLLRDPSRTGGVLSEATCSDLLSRPAVTGWRSEDPADTVLQEQRSRDPLHTLQLQRTIFRFDLEPAQGSPTQPKPLSQPRLVSSSLSGNQGTDTLPMVSIVPHCIFPAPSNQMFQG